MQQNRLPLADETLEFSTSRDFNLDYPNAELVFGLVYAVGTDYKPVLDFLRDQIRLCGYSLTELHISHWFPESVARLGLPFTFPDASEIERVSKNIEAGNAIRAQTARADVFALMSAAKIGSARELDGSGNPIAYERKAYVLVSLKRPEEVESLRKIYGPGFFLIGLFADEAERCIYLTERKGLASEGAADLIQRDQKEKDVASGQRTRDTFQMADVFVAQADKAYEKALRRFLRLVFGDPFSTPTRDEHSMYLAYAASLRSGDLSRQVGAALACSEGDVISLGCNDVPAPGGGLYCCDHGDHDQRDYRRGGDQNDSRKSEIIEDILKAFQKVLPKENKEEILAKARPLLRETLVSDVTEYGRAVHAEMDALIAAGRTGVTFRNATLYTTTFPCHNCTRHIVVAGVKRVVYIEPYPKSLAPDLHNDAIRLSREDSGMDNRIPFEPFLGVGPRRFFDLFSLKLSSGYQVERKSKGAMVSWEYRKDAKPRVPMSPTSYLEREQLIQSTLNTVFAEARENANPNVTEDGFKGEKRRGVLDTAGADGTPSRKLAQMEDRRFGNSSSPHSFGGQQSAPESTGEIRTGSDGPKLKS